MRGCFNHLSTLVDGPSFDVERERKAKREAGRKGERMAAYDALMKFVSDLGCSVPLEQPYPLVPLKLFFDGNSDEGSIAANRDEHFTLTQVRDWLFSLQERSDVRDILLMLIEEPDEFIEWPYAENIIVVTSATEEVVREWAEPRGAEVCAGMLYRTVPKLELSADWQVWTILWD